MNLKVSEKYKNSSNEIISIIDSFNDSGEDFVIGKRNKIKIFQLNNQPINIKSFKIPNLINKFAYKHLRKSKAKRSFEYATILLEKGIKTPYPIAYLENFKGIGLCDSYYASEQQDSDLTFRTLILQPNYPDYENILRQFTRFTHDMHEKGIEFKDHSPGNTLIKKTGESKYEFYLVDLNRMKFHDNPISLDLKMKNFSRLSPKKEMVKIMSDEYAKLSNENSHAIFDLMWKYAYEFQKKYHRKLRLKAKILGNKY